LIDGELILCCDRRLVVRECDCFCLGTAMGGQQGSEGSTAGLRPRFCRREDVAGCAGVVTGLGTEGGRVGLGCIEEWISRSEAH